MTISNEIIEVLEYLCDKIGLTIDWTSNNVIPYVTQLFERFIKWEISTSIVWIAIMGIVTILLAAGVIAVCKWADDEEVSLATWIVFVAWIIASVCVIGCQVFDIVECNIFPEKALYDYINYHINNTNLF